MKVALIWPHGFDRTTVMPLALGYLKSNLDLERHEVRIVNCVLTDRDARSPALAAELREFAPRVVGVTCWGPTFPEAMDLFRLVRNILPDAVTVIGGVQASSYYEKIIQNKEIDFLFRGEAELSFPVFLDELEQQNPDWSRVKGLTWLDGSGQMHTNDVERETNLDRIRIPDYAAMDLQGYRAIGYRWNTTVINNAPIWVTRGCPYQCTFCNAPNLNGRDVRVHSLEYVVAWIKYLYDEWGTRWFNIIDDNFTFNVDYAKRFCRAMIALNLPGIGFGTPNGIRMQRGDPELWRLMKQAGWRFVIVAPESGSPRTLQRMKKKINLDLIPGVVDQLRKAGLKVQAFFIVGFPGETREDLMLTLDFIRRCRFNFIFLGNFQPLPGTPIYDELVREGEIVDGLLPKTYSDGVRTYTPSGLKDFNFPGFILRTYLMFALRDPLNIPYMLKIFNPRFLLGKLMRNIAEMLKRTLAWQK
ncbi:MAG: B12-binding domain-containing radical SAM protein [Magnetococcus sp. DMHC-1]|nr:B12-binding domain-containing radical SAM protein [Magnetococcales bacterium]